MDFRFGEEEERFRQEVRSFLEEELNPDFQRELMARPVEERMNCKEFTDKLAQRGWLGIAWPKEYGGQERPYMEQIVYAEEIGYRRAPVGFNKYAVDLAGPLLIRVGSPEQKGEYLTRILSGKISFCLGYTEPGAGSDLASIQTRASNEGGMYVINGQKTLISSAEWADYCLLAVRTDPDAPKRSGLSLLIVDMRTPGVTIRPLPVMYDYQTVEIFFDDVRVPKTALVGEENRGWEYLTTALDVERVVVGAVVAMLQNTFDALLGYAKETCRNGKPLAADTQVRDKLAQLAIELQVARLFCYRAACLLERGEVPFHEASITKVFSTELERRLTNVGMQFMGLYGQLEEGSKWAPLEGRMEREYRFSLVSGIGGGTNELQRTLIAVAGLGLPR